MDKFLLIKMEGECKYCYFQNDIQNNSNTFCVEFGIGADSYDRLYWWGREDKSNICSLLQFVYPPYIKGEWRKIDMSGKQNIGNFDKIVDQALKDVELLKESIKDNKQNEK